MPTGESVANSATIKVAGQPLAEDVRPLLVHALVDDSTRLPDMFVLRFTDPQSIVLQKAGLALGTKVSISARRSEQTGDEVLLVGEVTSLEVEIAHGGQHTVVRGYDKSHRLFHGTTVAAYQDVTLSDVVSQVASRNGLSSQVDATQGIHKHVLQEGISDWDFLQRLSRQAGHVLTLVDSTLRFTKPAPASGATSATASRTNDCVIEAHVNVVDLRATLTASDQVKQVQVRSWDRASKKAIVGTARPLGENAQPSGSAATPLAALGALTDLRSEVVHLHQQPGLPDQAAAETSAKALAARLSGGFAEIEGTATGDTSLRAGSPVNVKGCGTTFDGKYVLTSTRHHFDPQRGYQTSFTASDGSERSLLGLSTGDGPAASTSAFAGVAIGVVTNLQNDPAGLGRVRLKLPTMSDDTETWWAPVLQLGAGNGRGTTWLPEVNDEVLVAFAQGDPQQPFVLGGLYNGLDKPDRSWDSMVGGSDGKVQRRAFVSRTKMLLEFVETPQDEKLTVSTNDGAQRITLTQTADKGIEIVSEGPMTVTALKDITVTGKQKVLVDAKQDVAVRTTTGKVAVESTGGDITLKGMNVSVEATAKLDLKGTTVSLAGTGAAEVKSSGVTSVTGSLVKIN